MSQNKTPATISGQVITPARLEKAAANANAERERIRLEAHEEGKHHGLRLASRWRIAALLAVGFIFGAVVCSLFVMSVYDRGAVGATAIADRVLGRTLPDPATTLPSPLSVRDAAAEYNANSAAAREGCSAQELREGRRNCR